MSLPETSIPAGDARNDSKNASAMVAEGIELEMERDPTVVAIGEDVGRMGGVFGSTRKLQSRFGDKRVRDMPIAEQAFAGMGVGMAMAGLRPVVEIMFVDFIGVCLDQVFNEMAKIPYMSGGRVKMPMVLKTAGGCIGDAAQHSQCLWGLLAHLPGMKVVVPSTTHDYKGLMASAIQCDDPVIFIEHKKLLMTKGSERVNHQPVPNGHFNVPIGVARVVREGRDVTLVSLGATVDEALLAADSMDLRGVDVEVIDLRSVVPLDMKTILASLRKTGRLLVADEDYLSFGLSAEIITRAFEALGPSRLREAARVAVPDVPIPAALTLEQAVLPSKEGIMTKIHQMMMMS